MAKLLENLCRFEQGLGRDTAPVEADAAEVFALNNGGLESELGGANCSHIAARTGTDNDKIEVEGHSPHLLNVVR